MKFITSDQVIAQQDQSKKKKDHAKYLKDYFLNC